MSIKFPILILILILSANFNQVFSQLVVDHVNLNKNKEITFVQLQYKYFGYKKNIRVSIDFGQDSEFTRKCQNNIYDKEGELIIFESHIGAINHLENNGWSLYSIDNKISGGGDSHISLNPKYLFKRKDEK